MHLETSPTSSRKMGWSFLSWRPSRSRPASIAPGILRRMQLASSEPPFKYFDKGIMAMIGRNAAVAEVGSNHHTLTGPLAFAAWLGVHALLLTTVRARLETFLEWGMGVFRTYACLSYPRSAKCQLVTAAPSGIAPPKKCLPR